MVLARVEHKLMQSHEGNWMHEGRLGRKDNVSCISFHGILVLLYSQDPFQCSSL